MYTHTLIFRLGDGGQFINCLFGVDSKTNNLVYKIVSSSEPLSLETHQQFVEFMQTIEKLYTQYKGVPIIMVKQDTYIEPTYTIAKK